MTYPNHFGISTSPMQTIDQPNPNKVSEAVRPSPIAEVYSKKENVIDEIVRIREAFGNRNTTEAQFKAIFFALGAMVLYAPEAQRVLVESTLREATIRETYYRLHFWPTMAQK